ncbi:hypothetical protein A1O3_03032 [Capronia epimyces CBS 606.96]|uniref:Uncharacterized protein n=1 Tax=Capronia epimyces CBS 606.96 TaxID=1182542 RepID=W9YJW4_9EURO|nr:uncharacterized protein A1O3_03032 [Capronia epimyces CBS 606.96]EXJ89965.1 hypothetical protein A1O3_03032 [Capronia epimyces CBS 606.96]
MVLGILTSIAACPAIVGTAEAVRQGQRKSAKERHRGVKSNLIVSCNSPSASSQEVNGGRVVLRDNKLFIATPAAEHLTSHLFAGYFLPFPEQNWGRQGEGLVSTISDDPPQLNWIYVDQDTYEIKYGNRIQAEPHLVGPWDCTVVDKRLTLEGWEGFVAVHEGPGEWSLYFDRDDDGLKGKVTKKTVLEVELTRKERRKGRGDE